MNHDIYIFGSTVRGEADETSDIDVLVIPFNSTTAGYPEGWSVYSPQLIESYFRQGRLFAWHLHLESHCVYSPNANPYIAALGEPGPYKSAQDDVNELSTLLLTALEEIESGTDSLVFELGIVYTAIRDIAMSASWSVLGAPCFSRTAPYVLPTPVPLPREVYDAAMRARHSSTRGVEYHFDAERIARALLNAPITEWVKGLRKFI